MFYTKNVPTWERVLRIGVSFTAAFITYRMGFNIFISISLISFSLTGFLGFCPMCALYGRKLSLSKKGK